MKKILFFLAIVLVGFNSCDKVDNVFIPDVNAGIDVYAFYPDGDSTHYADNVWPAFATNTNTDRNVLIEDFTGHQCTFCPAAAAVAHQLEEDNPGRVFVSAIHAGATGHLTVLQGLTLPTFVIDFTNPEGFDIGFKFTMDWPGSLIQGNPFGTVNRKDHGDGLPTTLPAFWESSTNSVLATNDFKVNIQAVSNYYPSTGGFFLHSEIDVVDPSLTNELKVVVHLIEDSLISPQKYPGYTEYNYIHRDLFRGSIDGLTYGKTLDVAHMTVPGTYEFFHFYELPSEYNSDNMHVIIYVRDAVTEEVYQVIKQSL